MRSVRLAVTSGYLRRARAPLVSLLSTSLRSFQTQEISPGEISLVEPSEGAANPSEAAVGGSTKIETSNEIPTYFNDTKHVDAFSRARVVNFIKRFSQGTVASGSEVFKGREVRNSDGSTLFHSCVRLPFRTETSEIWAHGLACNSKDAELLAAMHAEYIIDEFGYHIYTLPSMQRKHAEAARKAGRWAPMPDDIDRARSSVRIPPPLRRIVDSDETENGKWLLIDMQPNHYISPSHTLLSPCLLDTTSAHRIKALFDEHKLSFAELCTSQAEEAVESSGQTWYVATIIIPIELTTFSEIKAQGKALNREAAITLACMHAELVLDAHYICLYPHDSIMQKQHALAAWSYGRPAPLPGECQKNPLHVASPLPLKQLASRREDRVSCMSYEEDLVVRHRALTRQTCEFTDTPVLEHKAVGQIKQFLKEQNVARTDPFFVEEVSGYYKATVVLPIPDLFGIRGGVGIAINAPDACTLAAMHAIDVLNSLGLGISLDGTAVQRCGGEPVSSDTQDPGQLSPPGRRKLGALSSPTVVGGSNEGSVSQTAETSGSQTRRRRVTKRAHITTAEAEGLTNDGRKDEMQKETDVGDYLKARETVSKELWSLEADSPDGYIMVSPEDETCGYTIRLDTRPGRCINFCTSGVLLRLLHSAPLLTGINYLIIDEIHERDINSDFLLILLRQLLRRRRDLRVILMSATLQAEQFGKYFGDAPIINVEGYMHAVQELYVEDLVPLAMEHNLLTPLLKEAAATLDLENENSARGYSAPVPITTSKYGFLEATAEIDYMAIQFAIEHAVRSLDLTDSSVLVFLPGWDEIIKAKEILERNTKYYILSLHSSVGPEEQMQCFLPAPEGKVKIILSTNIAESGVTIDDVAVVIDVGRGKEKSYVMEKGMTSIGRNEMGSMSQLVTVYASRANCVQRRGRVGRTRPGMCIRLYSRRHFQSLHDFQTPEMLRTHLDALCLQILALDLGDPADFLQQALEPPSSENIEAAMKRLNELGATTYTRQLTPLGLRLSRLPLAPKVGKMVIMGAILRCLDSALTIASVTDGDVFISAREHREAVRLHKEDLSHGTQSDVIASVNAFNFWVTAHYEKPPAEVVYDLQERLLSVPQLLTVSKYKRQFFDIIMNSGFISVPDDKKKMHDRSRADIFVDKSDYSVDALNVGLVKCVVAAGMFPNVVMSRGRRLMRNKLANHLVPCSGSVVYRTARHDIAQPYFVYDELAKSTETDRLQVRNLSNVSLWTILLMGTSSMPVTYRDDLNLAVVDEWIMFRASFGTLELIRKFKRALNICLSRKFMNPENAENNARLEEFRCIIKELVCTPFKPNDLVEKQWVEKGVILEPRTRARGGSAAYVETEGDTNSSMGLEAPVVSETVGTSVSE
uniref:ATP-dependent RNA helicase n=1 Tax=Trypanosoma vivax (strain Y486) TaxID=1055687 RepID=G0TU19_TRYVY|nr:conserved hypothetical protein, fragment [Trypanosoma vivax Y486]